MKHLQLCTVIVSKGMLDIAVQRLEKLPYVWEVVISARDQNFSESPPHLSKLLARGFGNCHDTLLRNSCPVHCKPFLDTLIVIFPFMLHELCI
jgi:hypothetical protein